MVGLFNIAGSILWSALGGRFQRKNLLALLYLLRSAVFLGFVVAPLSAAPVLIFAAGLRFLWLGTLPPTPPPVCAVLGPGHLPPLYRVVFFLHPVWSLFRGAGRRPP